MQKNEREPRELKSIETLRNELKVHARSFKSDVKDEWRRIEGDWKLLQRQLRPAKRATEKSASEVKAASEILVKSLKRGYERIKHSLAS